MASRRELKKTVNYISGELFSECLINSMFVPGTDKAKFRMREAILAVPSGIKI